MSARPVEEQAREIVDYIMNRFDAAFDDRITPDEMREQFAREGLDAPTAELLLEYVMENWDADGDGVIKLSEVVRLAKTWAGYSGDAAVPA